MQSQPEKHLYEYAVVRYCPNVEREEFVNIGLVMMCKRRRWLRAEIALDRNRIMAFTPQADLDSFEKQLEGFLSVARGDHSPIGSLEAHERFRWLTAVRSASLTTSRPHPGKTADLDTTFATLMDALVR
ncbi:MAG: DUF3037 domain-containing protein [Bacteroidales bacterium]|nr:DUF3037 domain-containing protein [Bacteroidales bacterium]